MNIYEKKLTNTNEIFDEVKSLIENGNIGCKIQIAGMFSAAQKEYENTKLKKVFEEKAKDKHIHDIIILDEKSAIISYSKTNPVTKELEDDYWYQPVILNNHQKVIYETLEQALIGMVCLKTNNESADTWINKMLGINID